MSRLGKVPVPVPDGVTVNIADATLSAKGPKGTLSVKLTGDVKVEMRDGNVVIDRHGDSRSDRSRQGLVRSLIANVVNGVHQGFERTLEINGVGYRAEAKGSELHLSLGYSHPIIYQLPDGVTASVDKQTVVTLSGPDRQLVGEVAANIRDLRRPEPYKGKGIRYSDEQIRRKAGKAGATGAA